MVAIRFMFSILTVIQLLQDYVRYRVQLLFINPWHTRNRVTVLSLRVSVCVSDCYSTSQCRYLATMSKVRHAT